MEEMPSLNMLVQRLKIAILQLDLPCSGSVTHSGEILTTGKPHRKKPDRFLASIKRDEITTFPPSVHLNPTSAMRWHCWWVGLSPSFALWEIFLCVWCVRAHTHTHSHTHTHTHTHAHTHQLRLPRTQVWTGQLWWNMIIHLGSRNICMTFNRQKTSWVLSYER